MTADVPKSWLGLSGGLKDCQGPQEVEKLCLEGLRCISHFGMMWMSVLKSKSSIVPFLHPSSQEDISVLSDLLASWLPEKDKPDIMIGK